MATTFGDNIKDIPVDRDESVSPDLELINSIFSPSQDLIPKEVKLFLIGAVFMYLLFTQTSQSTIYKVSKNDNITKVIIVVLVLLIVYGSSKFV
jgi:hypothetical protein